MSKLRNRRTNVRKAAVAVTGAAALLALLTACNGTASGSVSADGGSAAPAAGDSTTADGSTGGSGSGSAGSGSAGTGSSGGGSTSGASASGGSSATGGGSTGGSSSGGSATTGSVPACQASQLGYSWADPGSGTGQQKHAVVALTNKSGHACTMYGFPGVDLVNSGQQWSLRRTNATAKRVTLANGASADFTITFLVSDQNDSTAFTPTTVVITAPNQRTSYDLPWHGGAVVLQDGATHPGTYVGPVGE
ncbi:MAG: DUF4232 domain-containing protein [Streptomyces sp.]|uniref:DUF4232 domain-containing protein n=1 Tax=Streptomyces sp. TaxID=1931 RepID=UPI0025CF51F8|nr:DUF4232 domain-containing protein [Streptomyces sp.]MBW8797999.1 DUF4232 domain-containing protein [Streptomyces sp.]